MRRNLVNQVVKMLLSIASLGLLSSGQSVIAQQPPYPGYTYPYAPQQYPYQQQWGQPVAPKHLQPSTQTRQKQPRAEIELSSYTPYIQQNLVLTLSIISDGNLSALQVKLPTLDGVAIKLLDGPITSSKAKTIVNKYRFSLTPLRSGTLVIPPLSIKGNFATASKQEFTIESNDPIRMEVRPANDSVQPWLALNGMIMQAYLENTAQPEVGKPIGLVINISAIGITGSQLPSLQSQLKTDTFRIYRESTESSGKITPGGKLLMGSRSERFTLVPQHGGKLQVPELKIPWWNVDTARAEKATVPIKQIVIRGERNKDSELSNDLLPGIPNFLLWIPLIAAFGLTMGFSVLAWLRKKRFVQVVEEELVIVSTFTIKRFRDLMAWISPIRRLQKVRQIFVRNLPKSFRLWFCVSVVDGENDPEVWTYMLRFLANKHLGLAPYLPLVELGQELAAIHNSDQHQMKQLMQELDGLVYGSESLEFDHWKKRFRKLLKPNPFKVRFFKRNRLTQKLPPLNPDSSHL